MGLILALHFVEEKKNCRAKPDCDKIDINFKQIYA